MEEERIKRYNDKLEYFNQTIKNLEDWTENIDVKEFTENLELQKQYAIYHAFQISLEIITDVIAMIVKDSNKVPKDDYSNLDILKNNNILMSDLVVKIQEANGLRNRIVHDYNGLDDSIAYQSILECIKSLKKFNEEVRNWVKKNC
ncbi:MAG: type VII toxin-antitoxin system HepT family RNase toxin [Promethearchaeota archaeon]